MILLCCPFTLLDFGHLKMNCSNNLLRSPLPMVLIVLNQVISMQVLNWFPGIVTVMVTMPFDQVLQFLLMTKVPMCQDGLNLPFFFSFHKVRGRSGEVGAMHRGFDIRH